MEELYTYFIVASFGSAAIIILSYFIYLRIILKNIQKKNQSLGLQFQKKILNLKIYLYCYANDLG